MYGTYGELEGHEGTSAVRFLYNGRDGVQTDLTGLYYMRARYYNPEIKRFINQDVLLGGIEDSTSLNRYSYVNGNPVNYIDPFGLEAQGANAFAIAKEIASYVPVLGNVISAYDAIQAFNKGDVKGGIINLSFAVPGLGNVAKAGKLGVTGFKGYKYWTKQTKFKGIKVYQRDDIFDINRIDDKGRTNLERMRKGNAPYGIDDKPINLHHTTQRDISSIAEVTQTFHQKNTSTIHINHGTNIPTGVNRSEFGKFRRAYWKNRAKDFQ